MSNLTQDQQTELKQQLEARHDALRQEVKEQQEQAQANASVLRNEFDKLDADAASASEDADLNLAMMSRDIVEVRDIEAALDRMQQGTYGECIDCGGTISYERLKAYPTAKRCIQCQTRVERDRGSGVPRNL